MTAFFKSLHGRNWLGANINVQGKDSDDQFFCLFPDIFADVSVQKKRAERWEPVYGRF
jgi:hypothetical protein